MNVSSENTSLSCEVKRYIGGTTVDSNTEHILRYCLIGYLILVSPIGVFLNAFILILVAAVKQLHRTEYILALQVVVVDILLSFIASPISIASAFAGEWIMGQHFCSLSLFAIHLLRHSRYWLMLVFVNDRFCSVFFPFSYKKYQKKFVIILSLVSWAVAFLFAVLPVSLDCEIFSRITFYCTGGNGCTNKYVCQVSRIITVTLTNVMGSYVPLIMYTALFIKAKILQKTIVATTGDTRGQKRKSESRINITFFLLFFSLFGATIIPFLLFIVGQSVFSTIGIPSPPEFTLITIITRSLYNILPILDAIAIMRNSDFRSGMKLLKTKWSNSFKVHR